MFQINQYTQSFVHLNLHLAIPHRLVNRGGTYTSYIYHEPAIDRESSEPSTVQELEYFNPLNIKNSTDTRLIPSKKCISSGKSDASIKEIARNKDYTTACCQLRSEKTYFATLIQLCSFLIQFKPAALTRRTRDLTLTRESVEEVSRHLKASEGTPGMNNPFSNKPIRNGDTQWSITADPGFGLMGRGTIIRYIYTRSWMITPP